MAMMTRTATVKWNLTLLFHTLCLLAVMFNANCSNCGTPRDIKDATYEYTGLRLPNGKYKSGAVVTYTCDDGFTKGKDSNGTYKCLKGQWTGDADNLRCCKLQICIDPDLFCVLPHVEGTNPDILAGNSSFPIDKGAKMAYGIGTVVNFNCNGDRFLRNNSKVGPYECLHGGRWSSTNFTQCVLKECGPPPTIANGHAEKMYSWETGYTIGTQYKYVCNPGYETFAYLNMVRCDSDLKWKTTLGFGNMGFNLDIAVCTHKYKPSYGETNIYSGGGSSSSSSGSGGYGSTSSSNSYDYSNTKRRREWTPLKTMVFVLFVSIILIFCIAVICSRLRYAYEKNNRNRAVIVNGITTTEYIGPIDYGGPHPTLTTGPVIFAPPSAPPQGSHYEPQGATYPPETYPLTSPTPPRSGTHYDDGPPPSYNETVYKSNTTPSAPY